MSGRERRERGLLEKSRVLAEASKLTAEETPGLLWRGIWAAIRETVGPEVVRVDLGIHGFTWRVPQQGLDRQAGARRTPR